MESLSGRNILVTGGTSGIGLATANLLAKHGAKVFIFGLNSNDLYEALNKINDTAKNVVGIVADVSTKKGIDKVFREIDKRWEKLDVLINNAGVGGGSILTSDYDEWNNTLDTNLLAYVAFSRYAIDRMEKNKTGHIVNIGSLSATIRHANGEVYVASKAGVQAFSDSLRKSLNGKDIKVTLIEPGSVGTNMATESEEEKAELQETGEMLKPEDIADAVLFALIQPPRTEVMEIKVKPIKQNI